MGYTVAVADPPHALVLWQVTSANTAIDPAGAWGDDYVAWSWAFVLEPVDAATTRLLVRMRVGYQPAARWAPYMWLLVEPAHFVMGRRQLLGEFCGVSVAGSHAAAPREAGVHLAAGGGPGRRCNGAAGQYPVGSWTPCGAAYPPLGIPAGR